MLMKPCLISHPTFTVNTTHESFLMRIVLYVVTTLQPTCGIKKLIISNVQSATCTLSGTLSLRAVP